MIPITGNTINSIDVLNGVASGFMVIASFTMSICLFILGNYEIAIVSLPLGFVSLAFYKYHKIPSKIFPGDSGASNIWVLCMVVLLLVGDRCGNYSSSCIACLQLSIHFCFLSSVKRIVEHRETQGKAS